MTYEYGALDRLELLREDGSAVLASFGYDAAGRRSTMGYAGTATAYGYDTADRLASLSHGLGGASADRNPGFGHYDIRCAYVTDLRREVPDLDDYVLEHLNGICTR